ncbi:hypothetical protein E2C01_039689 [Portunus trituberculatus]|uniref:Uncharacterized protein n=1 Tax=Portunus trituberculatus TaxID=210409 RepID=A0A5B7FLD0_PORTR|nr:hypothetical protein [Portunus trituberculatus]
MQRNQLTRMTKEDFIESILAAPTANDRQLLEVTNKLHTLVTEVAELRKAVVAPDSGINKKISELQTQVGGYGTVDNKEARDRILEKAKQLKQDGREYEKIFIKKDAHLSIRKEWKRLHDAERSEKNQPENVGCVIHLDRKERKLYKHGVVKVWDELIFGESVILLQFEYRELRDVPMPMTVPTADLIPALCGWALDANHIINAAFNQSVSTPLYSRLAPSAKKPCLLQGVRRIEDAFCAPSTPRPTDVAASPPPLRAPRPAAPYLYSQDLCLWFSPLECSFKASKITSSLTKFNHLPPEGLPQVSAVIATAATADKPTKS